ncbi:osmotically inducible protein C [Kaistia algarum]|uniref:OsmC family protein n=1 Tax=Kaistia algarum TaxID=2083279 RepID=UPI000CE78BC6|nr:OsmC family protein [Kaistia algarum]MCX5514336.1 OsmC family protein [Kaistia algarum]PPE79241.1 osmotically inducible protein C [Kaistia algarum]
MPTIKATLGSADFAVAMTAGPHNIAADEPVARGGGGTAPGPFDLVMSGLAACTIITLRMYAARKGWELGTIHAEIEHSRTAKDNHILRHLRFGAELTPDQIARLAEIAEKTPVTLALKQGSVIETHILPSLPDETPEHLDERLDEALEESFPASDPISVSPRETE